MADCVRLSSFPVFAPGELPYSAIARFDALNGRWSRADTIMRAIGQPHWKTWSAASFPLYLRHLAQRLPVNHPQANERLLAKNHTLLPLNSYFLDRTRAARLQECLLSGGMRYTNRRITIRRLSAFGRVNPLLLCSECVAEDYSHGFTYWHVEHQLPGATRCPRHFRSLELGCEICDGTRHSFLLINPSPAPCLHANGGRRSVEPDGADDAAANLLTSNLALMQSRTDGFRGHWGQAIQKGLQDVGLHKNGRVSIPTIFEAGLSKPFLKLLTATADQYFTWTRESIRNSLDTLAGGGHPLVTLAITMLVRPRLADFESDYCHDRLEDGGALPDWWWPETCIDTSTYRRTRHTFGELERRFNFGFDDAATLIEGIRSGRPKKRNRCFSDSEKKIVWAIAYFAPDIRTISSITGIGRWDVTQVLHENEQSQRRIKLIRIRSFRRGRDARRKTFLKFLNAHPELHREDLRSGNSLIWLRRHDRAWLMRKLPPHRPVLQDS